MFNHSSALYTRYFISSSAERSTPLGPCFPCNCVLIVLVSLWEMIVTCQLLTSNEWISRNIFFEWYSLLFHFPISGQTWRWISTGLETRAVILIGHIVACTFIHHISCVNTPSTNDTFSALLECNIFVKLNFLPLFT